jgi:hypothetical protein
MPEVELHLVSCTQKPMQSLERLADNIWFYSLLVPKIGWMRTFYRGCVRANPAGIEEDQAGHQARGGNGTGRRRQRRVSRFFPNVVAMASNMVKLAHRNRARMGNFAWLAARLENFILPRTQGVICNSLYTKKLVRPYPKDMADLSGITRSLSPATNP